MTRPRDEVWDAVVDVCEADAAEMTKNERGKFNAAVKQLKEVGATGEEVRRRAWRWKQEYPNLRITPTALCNRWSSLKPKKAAAAVAAPTPNPTDSRESMEVCRHGKTGKCDECMTAWRELLGGLNIGGMPEGV